ncbi:MAG: ferrochelatase [Bacteroidia bacterium]|nr:MAG: ferrochelatase [Bacteroidia bacterium]
MYSDTLFQNEKNMQKRAVLLVNLGSPSSPRIWDVYRFLTSFLNDKRVIDLPWALRLFLVNLIIIPFRVRKSSRLYSQVWTKDGSPLVFHSERLLSKIKTQTDGEFDVFWAWRYGKPGLKKTLQEIESRNYRELMIIPLFPQYASSSSGAVIQKAIEILAQMKRIPKFSVIDYFFDYEQFTDVWVSHLKEYSKKEFDHVLFSFHSLPIKQTEMMHRKGSCKTYACREQISGENRYCYHAQCYAHARLLASRLHLQPDDYTVCFQSRFAKKWLHPFTDELIVEKAKAGTEKLLVIPLSFVADCLETNVEIAQEYKDLFQKHGGKTLSMAESLNDSDEWVKCLIGIIKDNFSEKKKSP